MMKQIYILLRIDLNVIKKYDKCINIRSLLMTIIPAVGDLRREKKTC
jgi:hypothetical protein